MNGNIATYVLGALVSATLGGAWNRILFTVKYDLLVIIWLLTLMVAFVAQMSVGIRITLGENFTRWLIVVLVVSPLPIITFLIDRERAVPADDEHPWRIGCGIFLLVCAAMMVVTFNWWLQEVWEVFHAYSYAAILLCILVQAVAGLSVLLWSRDHND